MCPWQIIMQMLKRRHYRNSLLAVSQPILQVHEVL